MRAEIKPGYDKNRQKLADIVPLDAPFTLFIASTHTCNFRCFYCTQSKSKEEKEKLGFQQIHMEDGLFDLAVRQAEEFGGRIKRVVFTGLGEPLANPGIAQMVKKLSEAEIADGYEIITNGYLLTHEMTDRLLEAGLTYLRVSIQGQSSKRYEEITGAKIDFDHLVDNLAYFYQKRGACRLYIKIMDTCLDEIETEEQFYQIFGDICDSIYVEHLIKAQPGMMESYGDEVNHGITFYGEPSETRDVCPFMFYTLQLDAVGNVFPCPPLGLPLEFSLGNIKETSLKEIWNSEKLYGLYRSHLTAGRESVPVCGGCEGYLCFTPSQDCLDGEKQTILDRLEKRRGRKESPCL